MPGRDLKLLAAEWMTEGLPADLPCVIVSHAAQPEQQVLHTTLGAIGETEPAAAPSLLIAGWAVRKLTATDRASESTDAVSA
jgi:siroheme synthase